MEARSWGDVQGQVTCFACGVEQVQGSISGITWFPSVVRNELLSTQDMAQK